MFVPAHLATIVEHLLRTVAALIGGGVHPRRMDGNLILLIHRRLTAIARRVAAIAAHVAAGTLRPARAPAARTTPAPRPPAPVWPHRLRGTHAWLIRLAQDTSPFASQLDHLLHNPETHALIAAAPQLRRILRPLCRMLGVALPAPAAPAAPAARPALPPPAVPRPGPAPHRAAPRARRPAAAYPIFV